MKYRVWQVVLYGIGGLFVLLLLLPKPKPAGGGTAAMLGTIAGFALDVVIIVACFGWANRLGKKAKAEKSRISN